MNYDDELTEDELNNQQAMRDITGVLREQFKVACERAEAWKTMALAVRGEFGKATLLLGEASGYLFTVGTYHQQGKGLPERFYQEAIDLDAKITAQMKAVKVTIPSILKEEVNRSTRDD